MLRRRLGVLGADSLPKLPLLLGCSPLRATDAAFLICSELGTAQLLSVEVQVARATASAAALIVGPVGVSVPLLLLGLSQMGRSQTGICVLAMVVLPLFMYSFTSNSCHAEWGQHAQSGLATGVSPMFAFWCCGCCKAPVAGLNMVLMMCR
jgi:uncharacterized membrane-anchored protein YitT (DUF2179 family)